MIVREPVVLLVEDNPDDELLIAVALQRALPGARLRSVPTGEMAIQYLAGEAPFGDRGEYPLPDLLILDLVLPGISGFEVLAWRKERIALLQVPVLALTGSDDPQHRRRAQALGADGFYERPSDLTLIGPMVLGLLGDRGE